MLYLFLIALLPSLTLSAPSERMAKDYGQCVEAMDMHRLQIPGLSYDRLLADPSSLDNSLDLIQQKFNTIYDLDHRVKQLDFRTDGDPSSWDSWNYLTMNLGGDRINAESREDITYVAKTCEKSLCVYQISKDGVRMVKTDSEA
ncbi:MAG: hypothetical protein K2X47_02565, partial [Bdellovibrionales bacterium]|nr:hypothetical protein [Bdellovibrionales bacterium]